MLKTVKQYRLGTAATSVYNMRSANGYILKFDGSPVSAINFDGRPVTTLILNGTVVWKKAVT